MTAATREALMKVYGILLREGWDDPVEGAERAERNHANSGTPVEEQLSSPPNGIEGRRPEDLSIGSQTPSEGVRGLNRVQQELIRILRDKGERLTRDDLLEVVRHLGYEEGESVVSRSGLQAAPVVNDPAGGGGQR